jgi:hypothetical protein
MPTTLKFFVKENNNDFSVSEMTEPECAAIGECVDDLLPHPYSLEYWFETDTCLFEEEEDEEEPTYGLVRCFTHNPAPRNGSLLESRLPSEIPQAVLTKLAGKTFRVHPRQLGLSPWGEKVEVRFEALSPEPSPAPPVPPVPIPQPEPEPAPAPAPKVGVPVSHLIARALAAQ